MPAEIVHMPRAKRGVLIVGMLLTLIPAAIGYACVLPFVLLVDLAERWERQAALDAGEG